MKRIRRLGRQTLCLLLCVTPIFFAGCNEDRSLKEDVYTYKTDYVGDNTKTSQIAMRIKYPEGYKYSSIALDTDHNENKTVLKVFLDIEDGVLNFKLIPQAELTFALIENLTDLEYVNSKTEEVLDRLTRDEIKKTLYEKGVYLDEIAVSKESFENFKNKTSIYMKLVRVDGKIYQITDEKAFPTCGTLDGEIESEVSRDELPTEDNQSNFGTGYGYQIGVKNKAIAVEMGEDWIVFNQLEKIKWK